MKRYWSGTSVPVVQGYFRDAVLRVLLCRIVHENVEMSEFLERTVDALGAESNRAHVARESQTTPISAALPPTFPDP
jgi:hypothetical protein